MNFIIGVVILLFIAMLLIFPDARKMLWSLLSGFFGLFFQNVAKTPEGAKAIYKQKIDEVQNEYNRISGLMKKATGELVEKEEERKSLLNEVKKCESNAKALVQSGRKEEARLYTERRAQCLAEIQTLDSIISRLKTAVENAKHAHTQYGDKLVALKAEAKKTVSEMELNASMSKLFADLDELSAESPTDKLVAAVREGAADIRKEAIGSAEVHNNKLSTKLAQAEKTAISVESDEYLQSLINKYSPDKGTGSK